jgi:hypothetical protein
MNAEIVALRVKLYNVERDLEDSKADYVKLAHLVCDLWHSSAAAYIPPWLQKRVRDVSHAQLAEEQRFLHGAAAVTGLTQQDYDALVRDAMLWRTRSPTGAGGNARAFMCCEGVGQHAPGCIAQEAARCNCDLPMPVNSVDGDGLVWCITCGFNIGTTP